MNSFLLIFLTIPALEIFFLIKVGGDNRGAKHDFLIFLTAIVGIYFAKNARNEYDEIWDNQYLSK